MTTESKTPTRSDAPALIAPFATWMVLMLILPSAPWSYAVRTLATLAALAWSWRRLRGLRGLRSLRGLGGLDGLGGLGSVGNSSTHHSSLITRHLIWGLAGGLLVLFLWVWPEKTFDWYRHYCMYGYTANAPVETSGWAMKAVRLFGSAFVISVAEELFFRKWLMRYGGFALMLTLFTAQHNRWLAAAITGAIYGWLAIRKGLASAIVAHIVTNLLLGIYVLATGDWAFW